MEAMKPEAGPGGGTGKGGAGGGAGVSKTRGSAGHRYNTRGRSAGRA